MNHILCDPSPSLLALLPAFWTFSLSVCSLELLLRSRQGSPHPLSWPSSLQSGETWVLTVQKTELEDTEIQFFASLTQIILWVVWSPV